MLTFIVQILVWLQKQNIMKNWQDMKELSYVGIKITKAKTIREGLTKCKIQKLTRKNPIYEHLQLHRLKKDKKQCQMCRDATNQHHVQQSIKSNTKSYKIKTAQISDLLGQSLILKQRTEPIIKKKEKEYNYKSWATFKLILDDNLKEQAFNKINRFKTVVEKFDQGMKRTRSAFNKMNSSRENIHQYFITQMDQIQTQLNQDKGLSLAEVKTDRTMLLQDLQQQKKKRSARQKKVKAMNQPIQFPFNQPQMKMIVSSQHKTNMNETNKLKKMITSLYDYKSKLNHQNKMKIVKKFAKK